MSDSSSNELITLLAQKLDINNKKDIATLIAIDLIKTDLSSPQTHATAKNRLQAHMHLLEGYVETIENELNSTSLSQDEK